MKNQVYCALLLISLLVLSGCGATGPVGVSLTQEGQYVDSPIKKTAVMKMELPGEKLRQLAQKTDKLPPIAVGNFPDDTGTATMSDGSLLSSATRQWMAGALVSAGVVVPVHSNESWSQDPWIRLQRTVNALSQPISDELKAIAKAQINVIAKSALTEKPMPRYVVQGSLSQFDMNIRSGGLDAELGSAIDLVAMNVGFEGRYQVSQMAVVLEIVDNERGIIVHSFSITKQVIANEKSFALLNTISDVLDDDIVASATPKLRAAEPVHAAQKLIAEEGAAIAIEWLLENNKL